MTRLGFLSPDGCSAGVALASPLRGLDPGAVVTELPLLRKLELRGELRGLQPAAGESLLPLGPGRALVVSEGSALPVRERLSAAGYRVYDMTAALTALEF